MKILVVDDIEEYLNSLENALKGEYEILKARNLNDAKSIATKEQRLNVAIVDIRLSEEEPSNKDGLVFLEWLKMNYPEIRVIIMSAYKEFDLAVDALNLGAEYFLKKPINLVELKGILKTPLKK